MALLAVAVLRDGTGDSAVRSALHNAARIVAPGLRLPPARHWACTKPQGAVGLAAVAVLSGPRLRRRRCRDPHASSLDGARTRAGGRIATQALAAPPLGQLPEDSSLRKSGGCHRAQALRGGLATGLTLGSPVLLPGRASSAVAAAQTVPLTVGLGTCCLEGEASVKQVAAGLAAGYRLIDTASHYGNEGAVARGIERAGLARSDVKIVTKVWFDDMGEAAAGAIRDSLARLETDYVDLLLIHFPGTNDMVQSPATNKRLREQTWRALEEAHGKGVARAIGVANFTRRHLKELLGYCRVAPSVNQLEVHPYFQQTELLEFCRGKGVQPMAFSPLAHGELKMLEDKVLRTIAEAHGRTTAQVTLRWLLQLGIPPVIFSASTQRLKENLGVTGFSLTDAEMNRISLLDRVNGRVGFDSNIIA